MKAITLWQPWASLVALQIKTIETRSWPAPKALIGQRIAIHASKKQPGWCEIGEYGVEPWFYNVRHVEDCYCEEGEVTPECARRSPSRPLLSKSGAMVSLLPLGAVVATATLAHCVRMVNIAYVFAQHPEVPWPNVQLNGTDTATLVHAGDDIAPVRLDDQIPYGDFTHGRWAWILTDIKALPEPVPATGRQGVWTWTA